MLWALYALIGLSAGVAAGFFGIGGGLIIVPALVYLAGFSQHRATGTSLAALLLPVGLGAVFEYARRGNVDLGAAAVIALCLLAAAWAGAYMANRVPANALRLAFGLFLILVGGYVVWTAARAPGPASGGNP